MSKIHNFGNTIERVITYVLIVLLVLCFAGGIAYFTLRSQGVSYYVEFQGTKYYGNGEGGSLSLPDKADYRFNVKSLTGETVNFDVKIIANKANNFDISAEDINYPFYGNNESLNDYSDVFGLKKDTESFSITIPENYTVEKAIRQKYGSQAEIQSELQNDLPYFIISVSVDESIVDLRFVFNVKAVGISLNPSEIVF